MDPISNMLTTINNAQAVKKETVLIPYSGVKNSIAKVLGQNGLVGDVAVDTNEKGFKVIKINLKYDEQGRSAIAQIRRVSKPGRRVYAKANNIPKPKGGYGIIIVSTPKGILTGEQASKIHSGGEIICEVLL